MIKQGLVSILAGLSIGLMFCLYFVRDKAITQCHNTGPYTCKVAGPNLIELSQNNGMERAVILVALEKK